MMSKLVVNLCGADRACFFLSSLLVLPPNPVKSCTSLGLLNDLNSLVASFRSCSTTCARCTWLCRGGCSGRPGGAAALFKENYHFSISECFGRMKDKAAYFFLFLMEIVLELGALAVR